MEALKINQQITKNKEEIEAKVLQYFGALLNGHHDRNGVYTGQPFIPDYSDLPDFLADLGQLSQASQENLQKNLTYEQVKFVVLKKCDRNKSPGLDGLPY